MSDGSSQGLFVVVAVIIFGIFVAVSYSLFRDQLTPSIASIFNEHSTTLPADFYLTDTPTGVEYTTTAGEGGWATPGFEEYVNLPNYDLSKLGDNFKKNTIYELTFSMRTTKEGEILVYTQNEGSRKYFMLSENSNFKKAESVNAKGGDLFYIHTFRFILNEVNLNEHLGKSFLAFFSGYDSANKITVKDISVRKVGTLKQ